ncbi:MAG: hypothetical protein BWY15_00825 [Firmicutes bacterium ADurb.Bin193]|nr:MAG: hypothetical protein BWY15_00825 [Firmicutes bacterium ADurb.Bin193]
MLSLVVGKAEFHPYQLDPLELAIIRSQNQSYGEARQAQHEVRKSKENSTEKRVEQECGGDR